MKKASLFVLFLGTLALSSCCCQGTNPPKLRPMPKDVLDPATVVQEPVFEPIKIEPSKK